ncbi:MAG: SCP2 sterol-binding domain-containing protein [Rhodospirillales bacterium]|nr:SCP2 sterol-binding domain-containing protein [Rhodospirillales bacterium]MDE2576837.1 SCP2 sterol-binding domain-containing protein [Rhodospirillales bacterium]
MAIGLPAPVFSLGLLLRTLPRPILALALRRVSAGLEHRHAALLRRLARLAPATFLFEPQDVPERFLLAIRPRAVTLGLAAAGTTADVTMRGRLATLIGLLEGRTDSDTVYFTRELSVTGDTEKAVGFRNILDGEAINLIDDALAALGPLARPMERIAGRLDARVRRIAGRVGALGREAHRAAHGGRDVMEDHRAITAGITALDARLAKLERRGRRAAEPA